MIKLYPNFRSEKLLRGRLFHNEFKKECGVLKTGLDLAEHKSIVRFHI